MEKYDTFKTIKLEDTGLIQNNSKDLVYNLLSKNNIRTLKELFELDDLNLIDYDLTKDNIKIYQTKGVIKLLRSYYLNEELPFKRILESTIKDNQIIIDDNVYKFTDIFLSLGFTFYGSVSMRDKSPDNIKVIKLLESVLDGKIKLVCNKKEEEKNLNRLGIIVEWYHKKATKPKDISIEELKDLKEQILYLKNNNLNKEEYYLLKIKLNRILSKKLYEVEIITKELKQLKKILNK